MWFLDDKLFDGRHELLPGFREVFKAFLDLSVPDWATVIGGILWLVLLTLSLKSVDRRDAWTGVTYCLFMTAAGVMLMLAIPEHIRGSDSIDARQVLVILTLPAIAGLRWIWRRSPTPRAIAVAQAAKSKKES